MEHAIVLVTASILAGLLLFIIGRAALRSRARRGPPRAAARREPCMLCGSALDPGERVKTALFPGGGDRLAHVFGCPRCYPANDRNPRRCPVCHATLPPDGWVVGRMFDRSRGSHAAVPRPRSHLHILGCAACRGARVGAPR